MSEKDEKLDRIIDKLGRLETALMGIRGDGGIVAELENIGKAIHKQGNSISENTKDINSIRASLEHVKKDNEKDINGISSRFEKDIGAVSKRVDKAEEKISDLFKLTNQDRVAAAGTSTKVGLLLTFVMAIASVIYTFLTKSSQ